MLGGQKTAWERQLWQVHPSLAGAAVWFHRGTGSLLHLCLTSLREIHPQEQYSDAAGKSAACRSSEESLRTSDGPH